MSGGIYKIVNLVNEKVYVGSAKNFNRRKNQHFNALIKGCHPNIKLQNSVNSTVYIISNLKLLLNWVHIIKICTYLLKISG